MKTPNAVQIVTHKAWILRWTPDGISVSSTVNENDHECDHWLVEEVTINHGQEPVFSLKLD